MDILLVIWAMLEQPVVTISVLYNCFVLCELYRSWKQPKLQRHYQAPFVEATHCKVSIILHIFLVLLLVCFWFGSLAKYLLILQTDNPLCTRKQAELQM